MGVSTVIGRGSSCEKLPRESIHGASPSRSTIIDPANSSRSASLFAMSAVAAQARSGAIANGCRLKSRSVSPSSATVKERRDSVGKQRSASSALKAVPSSFSTRTRSKPQVSVR